MLHIRDNLQHANDFRNLKTSYDKRFAVRSSSKLSHYWRSLRQDEPTKDKNEKIIWIPRIVLLAKS